MSISHGRLDMSHTALTICSSFNVTSLDERPSRTSNIASIPCAETSCDCISGVSAMILSCQTGRQRPQQQERAGVRRTSWSQASRSWKSGADGVSSSMSCVTVADSRAYLSRCRLASRSSSEKPSSIYANVSTTSCTLVFLTYLCKRILLVILISQLYNS